MKAVAEKEEQAQRKETENNRNQQRTKSNTKDGLAFQIHERDAHRRLKELQDKQFAEEIKNRVLNEE